MEAVQIVRAAPIQPGCARVAAAEEPAPSFDLDRLAHAAKRLLAGDQLLKLGDRPAALGRGELEARYR